MHKPSRIVADYMLTVAETQLARPNNFPTISPGLHGEETLACLALIPKSEDGVTAIENVYVLRTWRLVAAASIMNTAQIRRNIENVFISFLDGNDVNNCIFDEEDMVISIDELVATTDSTWRESMKLGFREVKDALQGE